MVDVGATPSPSIRPPRTGARPGARLGVRLLVAAVPLLFGLVLVVWPLAAVIERSFRDVDTERLVEVLTRASTRSVLWFTVWQAVVSTAATLVVGLPIAHALARYRFVGRSLVRVVVVVPFVLPTVVVGSAFSQLFARLGADTRSVIAIVAAHVFFNVAVVVRVVGGFWAGADRRQEEVAAALGAGPLRTFALVTVPRLAPVLAASMVLVFLFSFTSFGVIRILGGPAVATVETEIHRYAIRRIEFDVAAALSLLQLVVVSLLAAVSAGFQRRVASAQRGRRRPTARPLRTPMERLHLSLVLALIAAVVVAPLAVLIEGSLAVDGGYGIGHYRRLFVDGDLLPVSAARALATSVLFAAMAAGVAVVVGMLAALAVTAGGRIGAALETLTLVPLGVSAVTLGFGYLLAFTMFDLRRSIWLVPVAHAVIGLPFVLAAVVPALRSIDPRLREAAATLGAAPLRVRLRVDWPLVRPAVATGAGFAAAVSIGEFGATSFLSRDASAFTAPLAVFRLVSQPGTLLQGQALALSVVIGVVVATIAAVIEWRRPTGVTLL
ncbi:MAG: ABC transporter permease subunit [Actinomycetota bacterium]